jgi:gliding motility-associated-like protein
LIKFNLPGFDVYIMNAFYTLPACSLFEGCHFLCKLPLGFSGKFLSLLMAIMILNNKEVKAQACSPTPVVESVVNGNFDQGYKGFNIGAGYTKIVRGDGMSSSPGFYMVDNNDSLGKSSFNQAFGNIFDHTRPGAKGNMLMIDTKTTNDISWSTDVTVIPQQDYFFSAWVVELDKNQPPHNAQLQFEIVDQNGVVTPLGSPFEATSTWTQIYVPWKSGTNTKATIRIRDSQLNVSQGNDFALDDISFVNSCAKVGTSSKPDLGGPYTLCDSPGSITLDPKVSGSRSWVNTDTKEDLGTGTTIAVTKPGNYKVCINNGGDCPITAMAEVKADLAVKLGDITLCDPPVFRLDTKLTGPTLEYSWTKNGTSIAGATGPTLDVFAPGAYEVTVKSKTIAGCGPVKAISNVKSTNAVPVEGTFCRGDATFSVTGSGKYAWFKSADKASDKKKIGVGNTITYPVSSFNLGPNGNTITLYAEDTSLTPSTAGAPFSSSSNNFNSGQSDRNLHFSVLKEIILDTVHIKVRFYSKTDRPKQSSVAVLGPTGNVIKIVTVTIPNPGKDNTDVIVPVFLGTDLPPGNDYQLALYNDPGANYDPISADMTNADNHWPYTTPGVVSVNQTDKDHRDYNFFYEWKISVPPGCGRVPVTLTKKCPPCKGPDSFTLIPSATNICTSANPNTISLSITGLTPAAPGADTPPQNYKYYWYKGTTLLTPGNDTLRTTYTVTPDATLGSGDYTLRIAHRDLTDPACYIERKVTLTFETPILQKPISDKDTICEGNGTTKEFGLANLPTGGKSPYTYEWQSSTSTPPSFTPIAGATSPTYKPGSPAKTTYYRRVVSGGLCPPSTSDTAFIIVDPALTSGTIKAAASPICQFTSPVLSEVQPATGGRTGKPYSYLWYIDSSSTSLNAIANSNSPGLINAPKLSSIGTFKFTRIVYSGKCSESTELTVSTIKSMNPGDILKDQDICYDTKPDPLTNLNLASGGTGTAPTYTYKWQISTNGTVFSNIPGATDPQGYTPGQLISDTYIQRKAYVVNGTSQCDSAATKPVKIKVFAPLTAGAIKTDTTICAQKGVSLESLTPAAGGSPGRTYKWASSATGLAGSFTALTPAASLENFNSGPLTNTIYYQRTAVDPKCGDLTTNIYKVNVLPIHTPKVTMIPPSASICELDKNIRFDADTTGAGTKGIFTWYLDGKIQPQSNGTDSVRLSDWKPPLATIAVKIKPGNDYLCYAGPDSVAATVQIIQAQKPTLDLIGKDIICAGDSVTFNTQKGLSSGSDKYVWKLDGNIVAAATGPQYGFRNLKDGQMVRVDFISGSNCATIKFASDSIKMSVFEYPKVSVTKPPIDTICEGQPYPLTASGNFTTTKLDTKIQWYKNDMAIKGETALGLNAKDSGTYYVVITNGPCPDTSAPILLSTQKIEVFAGKDHEMYIGETYIPDAALFLNGFRVNNTNPFTVSWSPVDTTIRIDPNDILHPVISPPVPTTYQLVGTTSIGCTDTSTVRVIVYLPIWIPNAFSPNGDGLNDKWVIDGLYSYPRAKVIVYNRWGSVVYESNGYPQEQEWDGRTNNGEQLPVATYYYVVNPNVSREPVKTGFVVIIR